jgi:hypothetical protein
VPEAHRELQGAEEKIEQTVADALGHAPWTQAQDK